MVRKELLKALRRIQITTDRLATQQLSGNYASVFKGQGLSFREVREYQPGDDVRAIDWNVSARMGHPFVKVFVEEREMTVMLVVDLSASQRFGTQGGNKVRLATEVAALCAFSAIKHNDRVGLIMATDEVEKIVPPKKGQKHVMRVLREIMYTQPERSGTDLGAALETLMHVARRRSVVFLISDFYANNYARPLSLAAARHDIIPVQLVDPRDMDLPDVGLASFEDFETGESVIVDTHSKQVRAHYAKQMRKLQAEQVALFRKLALDHCIVRTDQPYIKPLRDLFALRAQDSSVRARAPLFVLLVAGAADAQAPAPSSASAHTEVGCIEKLPGGKARPSFKESFPSRGLSGHALPLVVTLEHGPAETVLPTGFRFQPETGEAKTLKQAGFILPDPGGDAGPKVERKDAGSKTESKVTISFVALPKEPGRHLLTLPPLPITVARASGELMTLCTEPHAITVEDPTSNTPNAKPKANPPPRRQREEWTFLKQAVGIGAIALVVGALLAYAIGRWLKRPRPVPPPPPPRPPWEVALEALHDVRHAGLTREGRFAEHFDRVSDVVRRYLGDRYGFDGLESTTREMLGELRGTTPRIPVLDEIEHFLRQADLVKFARLTPSEPECLTALAEAEHIVERTVPAPLPANAPAPAGASSSRPSPSEAEEDNDG